MTSQHRKLSDVELEDFRMKHFGPRIKCPARHDAVLFHDFDEKNEKDICCVCPCAWCQEDYRLFKQYYDLQLASPKDWIRKLNEEELDCLVRHYQTGCYCPQCGNNLTISELVKSRCLGCVHGTPPRDDLLGRRLYDRYIG